MDNRTWYIHAITFRGMRFESDPIHDYVELKEEVAKFDSTLKYFGGGFLTIVTMCPSAKDCVIESEKIF